jgi:hypothetical protein
LVGGQRIVEVIGGPIIVAGEAQVGGVVGIGGDGGTGRRRISTGEARRQKTENSFGSFLIKPDYITLFIYIAPVWIL